MAIPKPITRVEQYLASIAGASDVTLPTYPITREEYYLASWAEKSGFEIAEVDGTPPLVLKDCIGEQFKGLTVYGKSTQVTTTGAQLIDINSFQKNNMISVKIVNNYSIELTFTVEKDASDSSKVHLKVLINADILVGKTITMSYDEWNSNVPNEIAVCGIAYNINEEQYYENLKNSGIKTKTVTIPLDAKNCRVRLFLVESAATTVKAGTYTAIIKGLMICEGTVAKSWEPYTGGKPSPSPDYPQEIQSAGDDGNLSVIVKNPDNEQMQSVLFSTPNGLPGIPVSANGNYTDSNGQQWICDELDFERGVYRRRIKHANVVFYKTASSSTHGGYRHMAVDIKNLSREYTECLCNIATYSRDAANGKEGIRASGGYNALVLYYDNLTNDTVPANVAYILSDPIETPLSETDIAAYRALTTYKGTTILESECYLKVKYSKLRK